jgi:hypothetical protein
MQALRSGVWVLLLCAVARAEDAVPSPAVPVAEPRLENLHRLTPKVLSGAEPQGEAAFKALQELGVKTVISVDGAKPQVELAQKYGLRYVHLPLGYDGVPESRALDLAKATRELEGTVYVHCHHGKHRGPAAAVVACIVNGELNNAQGVAALKTLGTGTQYLGLWEAARTAKPVPAEELAKRKTEFKAIAPVPPLAEAMVAVDQGFDNLKEIRAAGWITPTNHPDLIPAHEALKLREVLFELLRTGEFHARPDDFKSWMKDSHGAAQALQEQLNATPRDPARIEAAFARLQTSCTDCHKPYRNAPKTAPAPGKEPRTK